MSEFVDVEWFGREQKIGIVLTYDQHDGFKCRMAPLRETMITVAGITLPNGHRSTEEQDIEWLMKNAAKIPFEWAWGIWGRRMVATWENRHLADGTAKVIRYDGRNYDVKTLEEVKDDRP